MGLVPAIVIPSLLALLLGLGLRGQFVFNPPYLLLTIALTLVTGVGIVAAYLSAKSYLATGSTTLLIMSVAFVIQSVVPIGTGWASLFSPSATVAIAALGFADRVGGSGYRRCSRLISFGADRGGTSESPISYCLFCSVFSECACCFSATLAQIFQSSSSMLRASRF